MCSVHVLYVHMYCLCVCVFVSVHSLTVIDSGIFCNLFKFGVDGFNKCWFSKDTNTRKMRSVCMTITV